MAGSVSRRDRFTRRGFGIRFLPAPLVDRFGIVDAVVENTVENTVEALGYFMEVFEGQLALIQLSVGKNPVYEFLHHPLDSVRCGVYQCS